MPKFKLTKAQKMRLLILVVVILFWAFTGKVPDQLLPQTYLTEPEPTTVIETSRTVARVIDGDTVVLASGEKVRYIGIDTPERGECFYKEATEANTRFVLGKQVKLVKDVSQKDRYGRLLRYVYVGNEFINEKLIRDGFAVVSTYPPDVANQELFLEAERQARREEKGFWKEGSCNP